jgi:hypothetical protein
MTKTHSVRLLVLSALGLTYVAVVQPAAAQQTDSAAPAADAPAEQAPQWTGLPFTSLADYEQRIPIGMARADLVGALGPPEAITPGRGDDEAYHYGYQLSDGSELRAVIIVRDGAVFIRRLYASSPEGATARVN